MRALQPPGWPRPRGYSNGIEASGRLVFTAGQIGWAPDGSFPASDLAGQVRQTLSNVVAVLAEAGAGPEHVVRLTWYVTDRDEYLALGEGDRRGLPRRDGPGVPGDGRRGRHRPGRGAGEGRDRGDRSGARVGAVGRSDTDGENTEAFARDPRCGRARGDLRSGLDTMRLATQNRIIVAIVSVALAGVLLEAGSDIVRTSLGTHPFASGIMVGALLLGATYLIVERALAERERVRWAQAADSLLRAIARAGAATDARLREADLTGSCDRALAQADWLAQMLDDNQAALSGTPELMSRWHVALSLAQHAKAALARHRPAADEAYQAAWNRFCATYGDVHDFTGDSGSETAGHGRRCPWSAAERRGRDAGPRAERRPVRDPARDRPRRHGDRLPRATSGGSTASWR